MYQVFRNQTIIQILTSDLKNKLLVQALAEGFSNARITKPDAIPDMPARLDAFLEAGYHGQMAWMEDRKAWRGAPDVLWPEVRSVEIGRASCRERV